MERATYGQSRGVSTRAETSRRCGMRHKIADAGHDSSNVERIRRRDPAQARALERWLLDLEANDADRIVPVTAAIADRWGRLSAGDPPSVVDCLMAATALENDLTLVTRNTHDVKGTGVKLLNPFEAGRP